MSREKNNFNYFKIIDWNSSDTLFKVLVHLTLYLEIITVHFRSNAVKNFPVKIPLLKIASTSCPTYEGAKENPHSIFTGVCLSLEPFSSLFSSPALNRRTQKRFAQDDTRLHDPSAAPFDEPRPYRNLIVITLRYVLAH